MEDSAALAWLGRKIGWGFADGQWDDWEALGPVAVIDRLVEGDTYGVPARPDPFEDLGVDDFAGPAITRAGIQSWLAQAVASPRPLETFMEFFWSDYFAVSIRVVRPQQLMFTHMNLLAEHALGNFREMLRAVTIDPAMLDFLDGDRSTRDNPNENYGRELLELYSVGVGEFSEEDVKAASRALTGWRVRRRQRSAVFRSQDHDDDPQTLLGVDGVHDVDTVVDAVLAHPATAPRVVDKLATAVLGPDYDVTLTESLVSKFAEDWEIQPVVRGLLELGVQGHATPSLLEPLAWYVFVNRLPIARPRNTAVRDYFRLAGQMPLVPPNVGGFPSPDAYLSTSATIARFNLASHLAQLSARSGASAFTGDVDALALRLALVDGFRPATRTALVGLPAGTQRLAAALASPDMVVV